MKNLTYILICFVLVALSFSCTDQSTFRNPSVYELENGAFIRFNESPSATASDPQGISFSGEVYDPAGNVSSYTVGLKATLSTGIYIQDNYFTTTTFPASFSFTSQSMADALGVDVNDFTYGDNFEFTGVATRDDGEVFIGIDPTFDDDKLTVGVGNTEPNLHLEDYTSAMKFATIIACASHEADKMAGTWTVVTDVWHDYEVGDQVTITAGTTDNEFIILNTTNPAPNNAATVQMIVTVDDTGNVTEITSNEIYDYGVPIVPTDGGASLVFSCVGVINLNVEWLTGDLTGTYGTYNFVLRKN